MSIVKTLLDVFSQKKFTLTDAYIACDNVNKESIRARIYENLNINFERVDRGVYQTKTNNQEAVLIEGDGRDLTMFNDKSIDCIITDHPWDDKKSNKGGSRNFTNYSTFQYNQDDFKEKARILKDGHFLVEFIPSENANNYKYLFQLKEFAEKAGFKYYAKVPWKKGTFIANTGRTSKNTEDIMIFTKGKAISLKPDAKKNKASNSQDWFMSGAKKMLPTVFDVQPPSKKDRIHQSEKPHQLIHQLLEYFTNENDIILDQFAGSGSTLIAAQESHRKAIGIEKDSNFCTKIKDRFKKENLNLIVLKSQ